MTVEIKELIIRATTTMDPRTNRQPPARAHLSDEEREALIEECVKQVLKILQRQRER